MRFCYFRKGIAIALALCLVVAIAYLFTTTKITIQIEGNQVGGFSIYYVPASIHEDAMIDTKYPSVIGATFQINGIAVTLVKLEEDNSIVTIDLMCAEDFLQVEKLQLIHRIRLRTENSTIYPFKTSISCEEKGQTNMSLQFSLGMDHLDKCIIEVVCFEPVYKIPIQPAMEIKADKRTASYLRFK